MNLRHTLAVILALGALLTATGVLIVLRSCDLRRLARRMPRELPLGLTFYDRQGNKISLDDWAILMSQPDYQRVAQHYVRGWWISTDWLVGMDTAFGRLKAGPLLFETMIFDPLGQARLGARYTSEADATLGHAMGLAGLLGRIGAGIDEVWPPLRQALTQGDT